MTTHFIFARHTKVRALVAAFAVVVLLGGTAACSSDSDSKSSGGSSSASKSKSGSGKKLPDGFPDDVPMPKSEKVSVIRSATDDSPGFWIVMTTIDPSLKKTSESLMAAYSDQLEKAGFELSDKGSSSVEAENDKWSITFHSSMDGTLTISTMPNK